MITRTLKYNGTPLGVVIGKNFGYDEESKNWFGVAFLRKGHGEDFDREVLTAKAVLNAERNYKFFLKNGYSDSLRDSVPSYLHTDYDYFADMAKRSIEIDPDLCEDCHKIEEEDELFAETRNFTHLA